MFAAEDPATLHTRARLRASCRAPNRRQACMHSQRSQRRAPSGSPAGRRVRRRHSSLDPSEPPPAVRLGRPLHAALPPRSVQGQLPWRPGASAPSACQHEPAAPQSPPRCGPGRRRPRRTCTFVRCGEPPKRVHGSSAPGHVLSCAHMVFTIVKPGLCAACCTSWFHHQFFGSTQCSRV